MVYSVQQIKFEILGYIKEFGAEFREWHIGVASNPKEKMQNDHGVDLEMDIWLYKQAVSFAACSAIQKYFVVALGTSGELATSGDADTDCVYLYKKSERTLP